MDEDIELNANTLVFYEVVCAVCLVALLGIARLCIGDDP